MKLAMINTSFPWQALQEIFLNFQKKKKKRLIYFEKGYACIFILFLLSNFLIVGGSEKPKVKF